MPDKTKRQAASRTGEMPAVDVENTVRREPPRPQTLPEIPKNPGATTGNMRPVKVEADDSAVRDDDHPEN